MLLFVRLSGVFHMSGFHCYHRKLHWMCMTVTCITPQRKLNESAAEMQQKAKKAHAKVLHVCVHTFAQSPNLCPQPDVTSFDVHSD